MSETKLKPVPITEAELLQLTLESTNKNYISLAFGTGGTTLEVVPSNRWALKRIIEMRGIAVEQPS